MMAFLLPFQTLQTNVSQENSVDQAAIDMEFRKELRRKIVGLHETLKDTQEALNLNKRIEKESVLGELKQRNSVGHSKK